LFGAGENAKPTGALRAEPEITVCGVGDPLEVI
jgi:hypothetical protein